MQLLVRQEKLRRGGLKPQVAAHCMWFKTERVKVLPFLVSGLSNRSCPFTKRFAHFHVLHPSPLYLPVCTCRYVATTFTTGE